MTADANGIRLRLTPAGDLDALERDWIDLERRSNGGFFLSWGWIDAWLHALPPELRPLRLEARRGERCVGLALLVERRARRRGVIVSRGLHLHETGRAALDKLTIEHNGVLADRDAEDAVRAACLRFLTGGVAQGRWDEVFLPGVPPRWLAGQPVPGTDTLVWKRARSPIVALEKIRRDGAGSLERLGGSRSRRLRRALRAYARRGPLAVEPARSVAEALEHLEALIALHESRWAPLGGGAFATPFLRRFHRRLVETRFPHGEVQILRGRAGDARLGYDYNFVYGGRVYAYQWGLDPEADARLSPGLVLEYLSVRHNLEAGAAVYDFLHGDAHYKSCLATDSEERLWLVLQRPRLDFRLENGLRRLRRRYLRAAVRADSYTDA